MKSDLEIYEKQAETLKVIAHPVRLCIINGLLDKGECNVSHMQECLNIPQSTVSQHLQKLKSAGIIEGKRNGIEINYKISNENVAGLMSALMKKEV